MNTLQLDFFFFLQILYIQILLSFTQIKKIHLHF